MGEELLIVGIVLLVGILLFCAAGIIQEELSRRKVRANLHAPLLLDENRSHSTNAIGRRVEVAVREARAGYRSCAQCDFTNPRRAVACVICGAKFPGEKSKTKELSKSTSKPLSWRQQRVRKRKEWVREINEDGNIVWRHSPDPASAEPSTAFPAYVLQVKSTIEKEELADAAATQVTFQSSVSNGNRAEETAEHPDSSSEDQTTETIEIVVPEESTHDVAVKLERELLETLVSVTEARESEPIQQVFSTSISYPASSTAQETRDMVTNAALDFPTKLAQFITAASTVFLNANGDRDSSSRTISRFNVSRASLVSDSINVISTMTPKQARAAVRVEFIGEQGIDAGGVYREWFILMNEKLLAPEAGIYVCVDPQDQTFYLNPHSQELLGEDHLAHFLVAGRLLGRALLEGNVTGFHLALPLLKIILGLPVSVCDLEYFDPEAYKNLKWLLDNDGVEELSLDFTVAEKLPSGQTRLVELVPGGARIDVTDVNKRDFVDRKLKYLLFDSVHDQLFAFLKGLYEVVPVELLMLFDAEELDYVLCGSDEIDVDDWERNTITSKSLVDHPALANFWIGVRALSIDDRRRMLQFATGATRVPPGGFSALTSYDGRLCLFRLRGVKPLTTRGYIRSHACFNRLDLPLHLDETEMRFAIAAVLSNRSFGFTSA